MEPIVSVVLIVRNVEKYIASCIRSILDQTFEKFELIIIDDFSNDLTSKIIHEFGDKRIKYFRNEKWLGIPKSRNRSIEKTSGEYVFFTDGDCKISKNWIEQGLVYLKDPNCFGVEGKIVYVTEDYVPTFSDHVMENRYGGQFMTGNMAYKKRVIQAEGCFDERFAYFEDRNLALRVIKKGKIHFNPKMIVYHPQVILTPKTYVKSATFIRHRVHLFKKFRDKSFLLWRIFFPTNLLKILFPPLIFSILFVKKFNKSADFRLLPFVYIYVICQRLHLWKESVRERTLLI